MNTEAKPTERPVHKQSCIEGRSREQEFAGWWAEAHNTAICGCVALFIGQQVGIIFSQGASCLGPARSTAYTRSPVGVDGVSVVTHTTTESVNDDGRHDYRFCFLLLWILWAFKQLLSPAAHQKWVKYRSHYAFIYLFIYLLPLVFSAGDLKKSTWNMIYVLFNHTFKFYLGNACKLKN